MKSGRKNYVDSALILCSPTTTVKLTIPIILDTHQLTSSDHQSMTGLYVNSDTSLLLCLSTSIVYRTYTLIESNNSYKKHCHWIQQTIVFHKSSTNLLTVNQLPLINCDSIQIDLELRHQNISLITCYSVSTVSCLLLIVSDICIKSNLCINFKLSSPWTQ